MTQPENNISSRPKIEDGGSAFPSTTHTAEGHAVNGPEFGMTLRDYFAAKAMQSIVGLADKIDAALLAVACEQLGLDPKKTSASRVVSAVAYNYADAMLEARKA
jgi:hypothetical protein